MNNLKLVVGEVFEGKTSHVRMQIVGFDRDEVVIRELDTGRQFNYLREALKRCEMVRIEGGGHDADQSRQAH